MSDARTVVVLAAGEGKRMRSDRPKVLHALLGRTMLGHVLAAAADLRPERTVVVVGHGAAEVEAHLVEVAPAAIPVLQAVQHGTGHAVRTALDALPGVTGPVVVLSGDTPLLRGATLAALLDAHAAAGAAGTVLSAYPADPKGLGRIVRDAQGGLARIVEERDATAEQAAIREINAGMYVFDAAALRAALGHLAADNDQGEEYLTDVFELMIAAGRRVAVHVAADPEEAMGCNDRAQLAAAGARLRDRVNGVLMRAGVTMVDPQTTWVDVTVTVGRDATIEPNTQLRGATSVGEGALVGPDTTLTDVTIGPGAAVVRTHGSGAVIGAGASVGPFAFLRPRTELGVSGKIGTFVETKNARIGAATKVPHLTYVGDATIGEHANIGAGTIFANYDGVHKHHITVGDASFVGSDSTLVAPVVVGDGTYIAAGSTIDKDVPPGSLGVARGHQRNIPGWVQRRRAGTRTAQVAAAVAALREAALAATAAEPPGDGAASADA